MHVQSDTSPQSQEQRLQELERRVAELTDENHRLQDQLKRKEQFTAMIVHDLRGPLAPIINYAQMLARHAKAAQADGSAKEVKRNATIQRHTSIIISQARRMSRLVNDLLDASRLSSGQFSLVLEECDMVALTREIVEQLRPVAPFHTLVVKAPEKPLVGRWDCGRLQQALGNLLDNAIKYSDEHTTITVTVRTQNEHLVTVSVHNQGASIPSTDISQLFRPYTRLAATSERHPGSGLGLFITKSIIEAHGGSLRLEPSGSEEPAESDLRKGATFTFELPLS